MLRVAVLRMALLVRRLMSALEAALLLRQPAALARVARVAAAAGVAAAGVAAARVGRAPLQWRRLAPLHLLPSLRLPPSSRLTSDRPLLVLHRRLRLRLRLLRLSLLQLLRLLHVLHVLLRLVHLLNLVRLRLLRSCLQCRYLMRIARSWLLRVHA